MRRFWQRAADQLRLLHLSAKSVAGCRYWIAPLLPLTWIAFQVMRVAIRWRPEAYSPDEAQSILIGFPMIVLAVGLGVRVIAGEIELRTLEIAYTVPGGTKSIWLYKLGAAVLILIVAEALLVVAVDQFCTDVLFSAVYGALQGAVVYLVLAMAMAALCKSEAAGALVVILLLSVNLMWQGAANTSPTLSPLWNPENLPDLDELELLARTLRNRIGCVLFVAAVAALAFGRAEQRERLLGG